MSLIPVLLSDRKPLDLHLSPHANLTLQPMPLGPGEKNIQRAYLNLNNSMNMLIKKELMSQYRNKKYATIR